MAGNRIPLNNEKFNQYINSTTQYLLKADATHGTNWQRLNLLADEMQQWEEFCNRWNDKWDGIITDKAKGIRNSVSIAEKNKIRANFTAWVTDPAMNKLNRIGSSPYVNNRDRAIFNITLRKTGRSKRPAITEAPFVSMQVSGGSIALITCREQHDSDRSSMHPNADIIEMRYCYTEPKGKPPKSISDCPLTELSKKAIFRFEAGMRNAGMRLYAYFRWRNNTQPGKSGPWSQQKSIIISS